MLEGEAVGGTREGYLRAVVAAARVALEVVEPMIWGVGREVVGSGGFWCRVQG